MPWDVSKDSSACPASKPWAVKKSDTGKLVGCHTSKSEAQKQQAALYAQEKMSMSSDVVDGRDVGNGTHRTGVRLALLDDGLQYRNEGDDAGPIMHGHFAVFNEWTRINSFFEGNFMERIAPGAFAKTFQERKDKVRVLFNHGRDPSVGQRPLGTPQVLSEDARGAYYEVGLFDVPYVNDLKPALRSGQLGASFKFEVLREEINDEPERSDYNPDGIQERTIKEVRLYEFGPVTFPAYDAATAGLRSITDDYVVQSFVDFAETNPALMRQYLLTQLGMTPERFEELMPEDSRGRAGVTDKPWNGSASRFSDEQYARSCVYDRGKCGGEWADKPAKSRFSLPIREPDGTLNKNAVHAAAGRFGSVSGGCSAAASAAKSALRGAYKTIGEDPPDSLKSQLDWDAEARDDEPRTDAPSATTPDDTARVSTSETSAARSKILTNAKKEEPWRLSPRGQSLPS